ncbi:unnamed protein product [Candida verbasci]|uniref:Transcription regulator LGE1 helical region domain-containing protein n=1 Tax=Candida verbasci TaxID=1227364 RepID=A0A9W4XB64_9ASCO|nr:unnamed protein product [Candida verbasci]
MNRGGHSRYSHPPRGGRGGYRGGGYRGNYRGSSSAPYYRPNLDRSSSSSIPNNHRHYKDKIQDKYGNPWIPLLELKGESTIQKFESNFKESNQLNQEILVLEKKQMKIELELKNLELQAKRIELNQQDMTEKLKIL